MEKFGLYIYIVVTIFESCNYECDERKGRGERGEGDGRVGGLFFRWRIL